MDVKKIVVASIFFLLMITLGLIFRPVPSASRDNTLRARGTIEEVLVTHTQDVVFKLKDDDRFYYVREDLEKDLAFIELQRKLAGKPVEIYYVRHWSPIDPLRVKHITKVDFNKITLYSN